MTWDVVTRGGRCECEGVGCELSESGVTGINIAGLMRGSALNGANK